MPMKDSPQLRIPAHTYQTGVVLLIAAIIMMYAGLTSAIVIRKSSGQDWDVGTLPYITYVIVALLVLSSASLELVRRKKVFIYGAFTLGIFVLLAELLIFNGMALSERKFMSPPAEASFLLLNGIFLVFFSAALSSLGWVLVFAKPWERFQAALRALRLYWHFLTVLWIYILLLLNRG